MKYEFRHFNQTKKEVVSKEETLEVLEEIFYQGFPKEKRKELFKDSNILAKYAFENYTTYYLTFYKKDKPFVSVNSGDGAFDLLFLDTDSEGNMFVPLIMSYFRVDALKWFEKNIYEPLPNNQVFLYQIVIFTDDKFESTRKDLKFISKNKNSPKNKLVITERKYSKKDNSRKKTIEETAEIDLSKNYFKAPQYFDDYEHLFDYESILNKISKL
ncbi:hypothetical protein [Neisseria montereyensis]|uniref:Uncharacterized protein n=1 Tax=Neisseria montereyensis TaxID=2973938 RepID=A0ABT2FC98_9NEIS|nr:hypothetical protein [Neisseria montereyensis]MCS4533833.1 hypothetical protein [Neisseria montereyensis]